MGRKADFTMPLSEVADSGNDIKTLKCLRHKICETIDESKSGRDISALSRQLQLVMAQIKVLEKEEKQSNEDTILEIVRARHRSPVRDSSGLLPKVVGDDEDE